MSRKNQKEPRYVIPRNGHVHAMRNMSGAGIHKEGKEKSRSVAKAQLRKMDHRKEGMAELSFY